MSVKSDQAKFEELALKRLGEGDSLKKKPSDLDGVLGIKDFSSIGDLFSLFEPDSYLRGKFCGWR